MNMSTHAVAVGFGFQYVSGCTFVLAAALRRSLALIIVLGSVVLPVPSNAQSCGPPAGGEPNSCSANSVASLGSSSGINLGAGNPINVITGNKYQREDDMPALPGILGLEIVRHYNSAYSNPSHPNGLVGRGWRLSYETELIDKFGVIQVLQADGGRVIFSRDATHPSLCSTSNPANGTMQLDRKADGDLHYTWIWPNGRSLHFNRAGKLERISAPGGEFVHLVYDKANMLVRVIDHQGRSLNITYFSPRAEGQFHGIRYIDSPVGRFEYEYGSQLPKGGVADPRSLLANLVKVNLPSGLSDAGLPSGVSRATVNNASRIYHYENKAMPWLLTGISIEAVASDGRPVTKRYATYGYDGDGRANLSTHAGNAGRVELSTGEPGKTILTNSLGQKTTYLYATIKGEHRLLEVRGPGCAACGKTNVRYGYNQRGQLVDTTKLSAKGAPLATSRSERDTLGRVTAISEILYRDGKAGTSKLQVRFEYEGIKLAPILIARPSVVQGEESVIRVTYNEAGQPLRVVESGWAPAFIGTQRTRIERTTSYSYTRINGRSLLARVDGPLPNGPSNSPRDSDITVFEYDQSGEHAPATPNSAADHAGLSRYENRRGILSRVIAPGGLVTAVLERDDFGRPRRISTPGGVELAFAFDRLGHLVLRRTGSVSESLSYNELGQLASVRQATGQIAYYTYDGDGRVNAIFDAQNNRIRMNRNTEGQLLSRDLLNPDGSVAQQSDPSRLLTDPEAPANLEQGWPVLREQEPGPMQVAAGLSEAFLVPDRIRWLTDHANRQPLKFTDARGIESEYSFDDFGRLVSVGSADAGLTVFRYDAADHLTSKTNGYGTADTSTVEYRYDVAGRVIEQRAPEGKTTIRYGKSGRPVQIVFPAGEERYDYDDNARLVAHTRTIDGHSFTTAYVYDERGQLSRKTLPDGQVLLYRYHGAVHPKAGLLAGIARQDLFGSTALLDGLNDANDGFARQRYQLANGVSFARDLDRSGNITRLGSPGIWEEQQRRDALGHLALRDRMGAAGVPTAYVYDPAGRLVGASLAGNAASARGFAYDAAGNPLARLSGTTLTRYRVSPANNQIVRAETDGRNTAYFYNGTGSLERAGTTLYRWDSQQRLIKVERDGKTVAEYAYNPFGERIKKVVYAKDQRSVTYFFYDGNQLVAEAQPNAGTVKVTRQYVWLDDAAGSRPIALLQARWDSASSVPERALAAIAGGTGRAAVRAHRTEVFAIVADHTGAPRAVVGEGKRVVWQAEVLGYGEAKPSPDNLVLLNLRGSNQYFDEETQLHYNARRYLDPASGRYLSADPLGLLGGVNPYAFGDNNPVDRIDPLGLQAKPAGPVSGWVFQDKLKYVVERVADQYPGELGSALKELVSPTALATTATIFTIWAGAQFAPYGWVADIVMAGIGTFFVGAAVWDVISGLYESASLIVSAKCEGNLQQAGDILAKQFGSAVVAAGSSSATAGAPKVASLLRRIFKDTAATQKAATAAAITESWFGKFVPGRSRVGEVANKEQLALHPDDYPPWANTKQVIDTWLEPGSKIYMINFKNATGPGGWATSKRYSSLEEARKELALLEEFKASGSNCCVLQEYTVKAPIPVRDGYAGGLTSRKPPYDSYAGGGQQYQILLDRNLNWRDFLVPTPNPAQI
jgi:RHS repeat-associated protein